MKNKSIISLCAVFAFLVLIFTCPNKQAHGEAIRYMVSTVLNEKLDDDMESNPLGVLGTMFMSKVLDEVVDSRLKVNNYFIFSTGELNFKGKTRTVSFGILGNVYTMGENDLRKNINDEEECWSGAPYCGLCEKTERFIVRLCEKWGVYSMDYVKNWGAMVWIM